jgi:ABC-type transport system involved in multi-copper enzyme maturation permease subunit
MFRRVAAFEFRYQLSGAAFWVIASAFLLMGFCIAAVNGLNVGSGGNVHKNAPVAIGLAHLILSLYYMLGTTALVANAVIRDDDTGFAPIIRSTRITKRDYLFGRFAGAFAAAAVAFLGAPIGMLLGSLVPWIDPETLGPVHLEAYAYAYLWLALPNILLTSAIFFALATATRSMMATYVGVVAFFVLYAVLNNTVGRIPEYELLHAYLEPFGVGAFSYATKYWTSAERNAGMPAIDGVFIANRAIWFAMSVAFLAGAYALFRFEAKGAKASREGAATAETSPPSSEGPLPRPSEGAAVAGAQLWMRTRFETMQVIRSPAFAILLLLGLLLSLATFIVISKGLLFGTPILPVTRIVIQALQGSFGLFAWIIAIYYAGELVWRERDRKINEIVDSSSASNWVFLVPKALAMLIVMLATLLVSVLGGIAYQLFEGYTHLEIGHYLLWYVLPKAVDWTLIGLAAIFFQAILPNKYLGWLLMVVLLIATITLAGLGLSDNLYLYAGSPDQPLSDMNGLGRFWVGVLWFRIYWTAFAILLMVVAHLLWRRGTEVRFMHRLRRVPHRLRSPAGIVGAIALLVFVGTGVWSFYNTHILNDFRTSKEGERYEADYEKALLRYAPLPQPSIVALRMAVDLHPSALWAQARGVYTLRNDTGKPLARVHVRMLDRTTRLISLSLPDAVLERDYPRFHYRIYRFRTPLAPGAATSLSFVTRRERHGFRNGSDDKRLVGNGTFLTNFELAPSIGMSRQGLIADRSTRHKYGLPGELRAPKLEDPAGLKRNYIGADWISSDIILSTDADQVPIAPGDRVSDVVSDGRRTARFVTTAPILNFWSIQSGRYAQKHLAYRGGIDLAVYYDPRHVANTDRMLNAFRLGLNYYQANFGPYPERYARIVEFPDYAKYAQAFAGTMPYSEGIGFIADLRDPDQIDYVTYVAAHELAHQWWAHQLVGADMQGATMLSETLAQYSSLMVMKHLYGEDQMRRFLKYELDGYLRGRATDPVEEVPLERVEDQQYVHYNKGSLVMYLLQDRIGEDAVNRALRTMLGKYRFKGAPFPRSVELVNLFRKEAKTPEDQALITDLFERITIYDLKAIGPTAVRRPDGKWAVSVPVDARKYYAAGKGDEKEAPLSDTIEIGLFTALPGHGKFDRRNVIRMERLPVHGGRQVFHFVTDKKPTYAGIDPYNFYIDRNSDDNVAPVI